MKYRQLGRTGLKVSEISFGTGDNAGLMMNASADERARALARAVDLGINYFDTSPDYGKGAAEANLGKGLKEIGAQVIVSTKVEIMPPDFGDIPGAVVRSLDASLKRLGMDSVDVLMIHNPPRLSRNLDAAHWPPLTPEDMLGPALEGLERVRKAGKAKHFGFTCENAEPAAVKPLLESGHFDVINCWYNIVNPTAGVTMPDGVRYGRDYENYHGMISEAGRNGVGVAVIRPLSGGALTQQVVDMGAAGRHANAGGMYTRRPESFRAEVERGRAFAFLHQPPRTLPVAGYQFTLAHEAVSTVVGGFSDFAQLQEIAEASAFPPLSAEEMARITDAYRHNFYLQA
ncbi:aldo/keto reductase [Roseiarcaceae bacterium H3SJ34-1]|uniref:aldo/keto reductase n=1 Tax=Terripilifer ovatus TaxID=3032367 RepID=UPI003AB93BF1|nr:aldo/keto reductase [Roseiarcaceae bacterium H3SJ34-1]